MKNLTRLSRLRFESSEVEQYEKDFSSVVEYINQIERVDVELSPRMETVSGVAHVLRSDEVRASDLADVLLQQAPLTDGRLIRVPAVFTSQHE